MVTKMIVVHVLQKFDIKLVDEGVRPDFSLGMQIIPNPRLGFRFKERKGRAIV